MEKNAKNKKQNAVLLKIFYFLSPQWNPTDSESYSAGLQLSFFFDDFRKLVM